MFMLAFGQGVEPLHVYLATVRRIREELKPSIEAVVLKNPNWETFWKAEAASVLGFMSAVGRMAAQIAMEPKERRSIVNPSDFEIAFAVVKAEHERRMDGPQPRGKWCL
jgi:hypothetical protein